MKIQVSIYSTTLILILICSITKADLHEYCQHTEGTLSPALEIGKDHIKSSFDYINTPFLIVDVFNEALLLRLEINNAMSIVIPNGEKYEWKTVQDLSDTLSTHIINGFANKNVKKSELKERIKTVIYEGIYNSIAWVVKNQQSNIYVRWGIENNRIYVEVEDEGTNRFDINAESPKEKIYDVSGKRFIAGLGRGLARIKELSDEATVISRVTGWKHIGNILKICFTLQETIDTIEQAI